MNAVDRYRQRQALPQALAYSAALQARGLGSVVCGAALVLLAPRDGGLELRMQRPRQIDLVSLRAIASRTGASKVLIEPAPSGVLVDANGRHHRWSFEPGEAKPWIGQMEHHGLVAADRAVAHSKTSIIDLAGGFEAATTAMASVARRNLRGAGRDELHYSHLPFDEVDDALLDALLLVHRDFASAHPDLKDDWEFRRQLVRQFGAQGRLVTAHAGPRLVGAVLLPCHDGVAHYYAVVTVSDGPWPKLGTGLVAQSLRAAIEAGCDLFDFVGIKDERYPKRQRRWGGFSTFKERFGGADVYMPPSLTLRD